MLKKGKNFLRLQSQLCAAKPRQKAFLMVALRHTIKGGAPRLACNVGLEWMHWKCTFLKRQQAATIPPSVSTATTGTTLRLQGKNIIQKKNNTT